MGQTRHQTEVDYTGIVEEMPRVFRIEPSWICNLRCICCPTGTQPAVGRGIMTMETFESIIAEVRKHNPKVVVFYHGGEPFLNKNFFDMVKTVKAAGVPFAKTVSNGMMIRPDMIPKIIESGLDSIEFSLDGRSAEENNAIRRGSDYAKVSATIKELIATKKRVGSKTPTVFIANTQIPTEEELARAVRKEPQEMRCAKPLVLQSPQSSALLGTATFANPCGSLNAGKCRVPEYIANDFADYEGEIQFKVTYTIFWPGMPFDTDKYKLVADSAERDPVNYCDHPNSTVTFRWNGDVVACCYDITSTYVLGNITREPLEQIWNNDKYRELRKSIRDRNFLPLCENCHVVKPFLWLAKK